jgi:hypothetical protein
MEYKHDLHVYFALTSVHLLALYIYFGTSTCLFFATANNGDVKIYNIYDVIVSLHGLWAMKVSQVNTMFSVSEIGMKCEQRGISILPFIAFPCMP